MKSILLTFGLLMLFSATLPVLASSSQTVAAAPITSSLYTGYQVTGPYPTLRVEGTWIVPTANCAATPNSVSNISVIIDGISGEKDAMEIGTYQDCTNGVASYGAFINIYPVTTYYNNKSSINDFVVHPGDEVEAQGTWRSPGQPIDWNTNFVDITSGVKLDTDAHAPSGFSPVDNSGAIVLSSDGKTLTSLSTISSGEQYVKYERSDITGPEMVENSFGTEGSLTGYTLNSYQMQGTTLGTLTDGGSSFQITF